MGKSKNLPPILKKSCPALKSPKKFLKVWSIIAKWLKIASVKIFALPVVILELVVNYERNIYLGGIWILVSWITSFCSFSSSLSNLYLAAQEGQWLIPPIFSSIRLVKGGTPAKVLMITFFSFWASSWQK